MLDIGQPNADTIYRSAVITPGGSHRITGKRGTLALAVMVQVIPQGEPGSGMRWQGFLGGAKDNAGLFHGFRIVKLSEIEHIDGIARTTPEERSKQLAARRDSWFRAV